jgi:hypothetical protein
MELSGTAFRRPLFSALSQGHTMKHLLTYLALFLVLMGCGKRRSDSRGNGTDEPNSVLVPLVSRTIQGGHIDMVPWDRIPSLDRYPYEEELLMVPQGTTNIALNKPVSCSSGKPLMGELALVTDGSMKCMRGRQLFHADVDLGPGIQYITIDLDALYSVYAIRFWHTYAMNPVYLDIIVQTANDQEFTRNSHILFNNDHDDSIGLGAGAGTDNNYIEYLTGKLVRGNGVKARYVRLYSNGNWGGDRNHYAEVEVYGIPAMD